MTSQPRDKTRDSTKHDTAKFGLDLYNNWQSTASAENIFGHVINTFLMKGTSVLYAHFQIQMQMILK